MERKKHEWSSRRHMKPERDKWFFVFGDEMQVCPRCQGQMRIKEVADEPLTIAAEMARLGLAPMPPPRPLPSPPGQLRLQFEGYN